MNPDTLKLLQNVSTATISTQLLKRKIGSTFMRGVQCLGESTPRMVGPAYTLRYVPLREDKDPWERLGRADNPARRSIEECPAGAVLVADARGVADCGTLGDILALRLQRRGVAGFVSDGGVRDVRAVISIGLPVYCAGPAAPASPGAHMAADIEVPIACGGVAIYPGDVIVGDADGVVVIPESLADEVAVNGAAQEDLEAFIQILIGEGRPVPGTYPPSDEVRREYDAWVAAGRPSP